MVEPLVRGITGTLDDAATAAVGAWVRDQGLGSGVSGVEPLAGRSELLQAYLDAGGRPTGHLDWYLTLACVKLGVVIEGTWVRCLAGAASREAGERLHASAVALMRMGSDVAAGGSPFTD